MAYNGNKPADDELVADVPGVIRENQRALKDDRIVDAGLLQGHDSVYFATSGHTHTELHGHTNKTLLDSVTNAGSGTLFLANNGSYLSPALPVQYDVNAKLAGCVGDGVTNDHTALYNIFANASNKTIYFPAGTYLDAYAYGIEITKLKNARFYFHPAAKLTFSNLGNGRSGIRIYGGDYLKNVMLTVTAPLGQSYITVNTITGYAIGDYVVSSYTWAQGIYKILNIVGYNVYLDRSLPIAIPDNTVLSIYLNAEISENIEFISPRIDVNMAGTSNTSYACINVVQCDGLTVADADFDVYEMQTCGLYVKGCKNVSVPRYSFTLPAEMDTNAAPYGLYIRESHGVTVDDGYYGNCSCPIKLVYCQNYQVTGNNISGEITTNLLGIDGLLLQYCVKGSVVANTVMGMRGSSIFSEYSYLTTIEDNIINYGGADHNQKAIKIVGSAEVGKGVVVAGNIVDECMGYGIHATGQGHIIKENCIRRTGDSGIYCTASYSIVVGNIARETNYYSAGNPIVNNGTGSITDHNIT